MKNMRRKSTYNLIAGLFMVDIDSLNTKREEIKRTKLYWQDVQVVVCRQRVPRTSFMTYDSRSDAMSGKFER